MATTLFWPSKQSWCGCCNEALIELLNWPGTVFPVSAPKRGMQRGADVGEVDLGAGPAEPPVVMDGTAFCAIRTPQPGSGGVAPSPVARLPCEVSAFSAQTLLVTEGRASY